MNEYNTLPDEQGNYHIYVALYTFDDHTLEINDFRYNFKK
jgi:uncharacterized protein YrzB (UPF0473 family)